MEASGLIHRGEIAMLDKYTEPHWKTSALIVIDMEKGVVSPKVDRQGSAINEITSNITILLDAFRKTSMPIIFVLRSYA